MKSIAFFCKSMKVRHTVWLLSLTAVITAAAYLPSLGNGFASWDDNTMLTGNPQVTSLSAGNIRNIFFSFHHGLYHPLVNLSYALEYHCFGLNPLVYHLTNLVLHLINTLLVYFFIVLLSGEMLIAAGVALFFGVHPLHVESVAWITERKDLLYSAFFLGGLIAYLNFRRTNNKWLVAAALLLCLLSLGAKVMAVSFPFILLLIDWLQGRKFDRENWLEKLPFFCLSAIFVITAALARHFTGGITHDPPLSFNNLFLGCYRLIFNFFPRVFLPWLNSSLYPGATFSQKIFSGLPPIYYAAPFLALGGFALLFYLARRDRGIVFGLGFFLLAILPALFTIPVGPFADRYTYLSSLGLFFALGLLIKRLHFECPAVVCLAVLLPLFFMMTWQNCLIWHDSYSFWSVVAAQYPRSAEATHDLALGCQEQGILLGRLGREREALQQLNRALELEPGLAEAYFNRGNVYASMGKSKKAIADYRQAVKLEPKLRLNLPPDFGRIKL